MIFAKVKLELQLGKLAGAGKSGECYRADKVHPSSMSPTRLFFILPLTNSEQRHVMVSKPTLLAINMTSRIKLLNPAALGSQSTAAAIHDCGYPR